MAPGGRSVGLMKSIEDIGQVLGVMPLPVSITVIRAWGSTRSRRISTRPPFGVNLMAFESKFETI